MSTNGFVIASLVVITDRVLAEGGRRRSSVHQSGQWLGRTVMFFDDGNTFHRW